MLHGMIICPDADLGRTLERALAESRMVHTGLVGRYPDPAELDHLIRQQEPQVFFLSLESPEEGLRVARSVEEKSPSASLVGVGRSGDPELLLTAMRAGIREFLAPPFEQRGLREALLRVASLVERTAPAGTNRVYSFLPSKPGVGASTVALHTCLYMARTPDTSVLLADFDLNNGMIGFMLRLNSEYSVIDAVEHAHELDDELWTRLVSRVRDLDVLPTGRLNPGHRIDPAFLQPLLSFARRNYDVICVDLSGMMEKYSLELMCESARILLISTPEVPALHLAAQKLRYLHSLELGSRVQIILNRAQKYSVLSETEMQRMLGAPVQLSIPNDYARVHKAMMAGQMVEGSSKLGKRFEELGRSLLEAPEVVERRKPRFLEFFSVGTAESCSAVER